MRVILFTFQPHYGGAARSNVEFLQRLGQHADVAVVDPDGSCAEYAEAVRDAGLDYHVVAKDVSSTVIGGRGQSLLLRLWRLAVSAPKLLRVYWRAGRLLRTLEPSVLCTTNFKSAMLVALHPSLRQIPLVLHLRGWFTPDMIPWYGRRILRKHCAAVLAVSHATKTALRCTGVDPNRVHVLHNPIDVADMTTKAERPLEAALPHSHCAVRVLLPAGIMRTKGQHTAVKALALLLKDGYDAALWLAGDYQRVGANRHYLDQTRRLVVELGVEDRVDWLGLRSDMPQVMNAATVVVLPTHSEGHPRSILEAMSLAKPVAATPVGGVLDMILPEVTGLYFDVEDDQGLAGCIKRFADDPEAAPRMGEQARDYVRKCFRVEDQIHQAVRLFAMAAGTDGRDDFTPPPPCGITMGDIATCTEDSVAKTL